MRQRVLVAEDDDAMRGMIARVLQRAGFQVIEVGNGADALDLVGDALLGRSPAPPEIVITDVRMPFLSGLQLLTALRALAIPTIVVTAFPDAHTRELASRLGAAAVLAKPFELDALCRLVTSLS
jgi:DNA-binding response OmpR family regulator